MESVAVHVCVHHVGSDLRRSRVGVSEDGDDE
jgi:hypothetical protein